MTTRQGLVVHPVTPGRWKDLEELFGPNGAYSNCWCMWWRMASKDFDRAPGSAKRADLKHLVDRRRTPGLLAYLEGRPVGWVSVAPREQFGRLERSPTLKRVDDRPVWSIVCFFIHRGHRKGGVATALLRAAVDHASRSGATVVEAYPIGNDRTRPSAELYTGIVPMFEAAGFREVARRGARSIMRRSVRPRRD